MSITTTKPREDPSTTITPITEDIYLPRFKISNIETYKPRDTVGETVNGALIGTGFGVLAIATGFSHCAIKQVSYKPMLQKRTKGTAILAASLAALQFGTAVSANIREKEDAVNSIYGGISLGFVMGAVSRKLPTFFAWTFLMGTLFGATAWAGNSSLPTGVTSFNQTKKAEYKQKPEVEDETKPKVQGLWEVRRRRGYSEMEAEIGIKDNYRIKF